MPRFYLFNTEVSGSIPGGLIASSLSFLALFGNQLSGVLPASFANSTFLRAVAVNDNGGKSGGLSGLSRIRD